jgi:hypothetical protein
VILIPRPHEGKYLLRHQLDFASMKLRSAHPQLNLALTEAKIRELIHYPAVWYNYWKREDKIDFSILDNYLIRNQSDFQYILLTYLILIKEIIVLLPFKREKLSDQELDYSREMRTASRFQKID